jgi:acyl-CoA reductase-like NAD-dependent aldehyde dehydrogenase
LDGFSWIAGEWRASAASKAAASINPATDTIVGVFDDADEASVRAAITAASAAFYHCEWSSTPRLRASAALAKLDQSMKGGRTAVTSDRDFAIGTRTLILTR